MRKQNEENKYKCDICDHKVTNKTSLKAHVQATHESTHEENEYHCEICDFKANKKASLKAHAQSTHENTHDCNVCDFKATVKASLERHVQSTHEDDITSTQNMISYARARRELKSKSKRSHCDICQMRFNKEHTFTAHLKKVHGDTEITTTSKDQLKLQMMKDNYNYKYTDMTFQKKTRNLGRYKTIDSAQGPQQLKRIYQH